jgi:hypothetical protein
MSSVNLIYLPYPRISLSELPLPEGNPPRSKREQIDELLLLGRSAQSIAEAVHTTVANVWKEKSILKTKGILRIQQPRSSRPSEGENGIQTDSLQKKNSERFTRVSMSSSTPNFQELYRLFEEGNKPIYIILHYNFHPEIVEKEYDRYMKLRNMDTASSE